MNKLVATTLESKFHVFDLRTHHPSKGYASVIEKVNCFYIYPFYCFVLFSGLLLFFLFFMPIRGHVFLEKLFTLNYSLCIGNNLCLIYGSEYQQKHSLQIRHIIKRFLFFFICTFFRLTSRQYGV